MIDLVKKVLIVKFYLSLGRGKKVVFVDFGMKYGILCELIVC